MGKKKRQKTKELSVAIAEAEASSTGGGDETGQQQIQPQAPRKRGRPRKIIAVETEEKKAQPIEQPEAQVLESSMKKEGKASAEEEQQRGGLSSTCIRIPKEEEMQLPKGEPSRSRARRKSKPRKSS